MILSYTQLCDIVDAGIITNVDKDNINSASIDIRLGAKLLIEKFTDEEGLPSLHTISLKKREPLKVREHDLLRDGPYSLFPGEVILGHSIEIFNLPNNLSAMFKLKSSCGRIFLEHMNAGWCDAGWHGSALTMEFKNNTRGHCITLEYGDKIGQIVFFQHARVPDDKSYAVRGRYNQDKGVSGTKPAIVFGEEEEEILQEVMEQNILTNTLHTFDKVAEESPSKKDLIIGDDNAE